MTDFQLGGVIGGLICFIAIPYLTKSKQPEVITEATPFDYTTLPDDVPTVDTWFKVRVWSDEQEGRSLTG